MGRTIDLVPTPHEAWLVAEYDNSTFKATEAHWIKEDSEQDAMYRYARKYLSKSTSGRVWVALRLCRVECIWIVGTCSIEEGIVEILGVMTESHIRHFDRQRQQG